MEFRLAVSGLLERFDQAHWSAPPSIYYMWNFWTKSGLDPSWNADSSYLHTIADDTIFCSSFPGRVYLAFYEVVEQKHAILQSVFGGIQVSQPNHVNQVAIFMPVVLVDLVSSYGNG